MRFRSLSATVVAALVAALALTACGSSGSASPTSTLTPTESPADSPTTASSPAAISSPDDGFPLVQATSRGTIDKPARDRPAVTVAPAPTLTSALDADGDGFYTFDELQQAVAAMIPTYTWPADYQVTAALIMAPFARNPTIRKTANWQVGYEYTLTGIYHKCGWERAWLDAYRDGDEQLLQEGTHQLRDIMPQNMAFSKMPEYLKIIGDAAALGDPAPIQNDVDVNCKTPQFITPVPGTPVGPSPATVTPVAWLWPGGRHVS